jgi:hypothetical protein
MSTVFPYTHHYITLPFDSFSKRITSVCAVRDENIDDLTIGNQDLSKNLQGFVIKSGRNTCGITPGLNELLDLPETDLSVDCTDN